MTDHYKTSSLCHINVAQRDPPPRHLHTARLPFLEQIQSAFGRHDVTGVQSHTGSKAAQATQDMGALAYATGNHVAFGGTPDLHTAAHEAAHIVQQRAGVQLKGGVGEVGDEYERHADEVADAVVQGRSAENLLDAYATPSRQCIGETKEIQRKELALVQMQDRPRTYLPPAGAPPRLPSDARIVDIDTTGLSETLHSLKFARNVIDDAWVGWTTLNEMSTADFWRSDSRLTSGHFANLSHQSRVGSLNYRLEIKPVLTECVASDKPGGAYSDSAKGSTTLSYNETGTTGSGLGANAGINQNAPSGSPTGTMGVNASANRSKSNTMGVSSTGGSTQGTKSASSIKFNAKVTFKITLYKEYDAAIVPTVLTLGGAEIGAEIAEGGTERKNLAGKNLIFTLPPERCREG